MSTLRYIILNKCPTSFWAIEGRLYLIKDRSHSSRGSIIFVSGGFIANSLAIMNDAVHQFFDFNSLVMSLAASWIARWQPNEKKTFGYYRAGKYFILHWQMPWDSICMVNLWHIRETKWNCSYLFSDLAFECKWGWSWHSFTQNCLLFICKSLLFIC